MFDYDELRNSGRVPRVHGNGFLQLDLNEDGTRRLHIWDEGLPKQVVATPIHDHVFSLRSRVLLGTLIHEELTPVDAFHGSHKIYRAQRQEGTQNTILVPDEGEVNLSVEQRLILVAGSIYTFPAWKLHQTNHRELTVTLMDKINAPDTYGNPRVLVPVGSEPDNDFHRDSFDEEFLWSVVQKACERV